MPKVKLLDPADARRRLDRYELIGEIASGGMATVFLARLAGVGGFQRFVAIKRLHPHLANEQEFVEMFLDEARLAAGIHHPNVVPIIEVGTTCLHAADPSAPLDAAALTSGGFYLVMEYIEGDTLSRLFARSLSSGGRGSDAPPGASVPRPILVRILLDALAGLHAAHELTDDEGRPVQLVHRDCSPQNILVGIDGCSRITDFGVARATSRLANTRADRLKGKLAYMAPEQAKGGAIDRRADVFAMGIVLWEVLSGRRLFKAESEAATLTRVVIEPIPKLRSAAPDAPAALEAVCSKALDRNVGRRFQSAAEMADALERAARQGEGPEVGVASAREVASYVQGALGQEIAAQRESVRVWLQHESSAAESKGRPRLSLPADRASSAGFAARSSDSLPRISAPPAAPAHSPAGGARGGDAAPASFAPDSAATTVPNAPAPRPSSGRPVLPVELPPDPPSSPEGEAGAAAREVSLSSASMAFTPRPSDAPRLSSVPPRPRRTRARLAGAVAAVALLGGGVLLWTTLHAPARVDGRAAAGVAPGGPAGPAPAAGGGDRVAPAGATATGEVVPTIAPAGTVEPAPAVAPASAVAPAPSASAGAGPAAAGAPAAAVPVRSPAAVPAPAAPPAAAAKPSKPGPVVPADDLANPYR